tara:strand:+ start:10784 stop:11644 length:861 start_codon:yes stop_codon:yes gene_type:complete
MPPTGGTSLSKFKKIKKSGLTAPKVQNQEVQRAIEKIYEDLNKLKDGTNTPGETDSEEFEGNPGDIRVIKTGKKVTGGGYIYNLEVKGEDGWFAASVAGKPIPYYTVGSKKKYETTEVVVNEEGDLETNETTYLEQSDIQELINESIGNISIPSIAGLLTAQDLEPDFDSGWIDLDQLNSGKRNYEFNHNLNFGNGVPKRIMAFVRDDYGASVPEGQPATNKIYPWKRFAHDIGGWSGMDWSIDNEKLYMRCYDGYFVFWTMQTDVDVAPAHQHWNRISGRILMWK